jgi:hypothetical protein
MKKTYTLSALLGFLGGLVLIMAQAIRPLGSLLERTHHFLVFWHPDAESWSVELAYYVFCLPFFLGVVISPWYLKAAKARQQGGRGNAIFLLGAFFVFSLGVVVSYGIWVVIVLVAISNWTLF